MSEIQENTFDSYNCKRGVSERTLKIVKNFPFGEKRVLVFMGLTGSGKTHLTEALYRHVLAEEKKRIYDRYENWEAHNKWDKEKKRIVYVPCELIGDIYFGAKFPNLKSELVEDYDFNEMLKASYLFIDDLGHKSPDQKNYETLALKLLLDRLDSTNIKVVVNTNLDEYEVDARYGSRISSRLALKKNSKDKIAKNCELITCRCIDNRRRYD